MKKHSLDLNNDNDLITYLRQSNPSQKPICIDRLRSYPGCENYSDEEAESIIKLLNELATIVLEMTPAKKMICIDNQQVVNSQKKTGCKTISAITDIKNKAA